MPEPIDWITTDAGFVKGEVYDTGRAVMRPNTQIIALTTLWNADHGTNYIYRDTFETLTHDFRRWAVAPGRRSQKRRFFGDRIMEGQTVSLNRYRMPPEFYKPWIAAHFPEMEWISTTFIGSKTKLHLEEDAFDPEQLVLARCSTDELVPIIKGVAHYPWDPNSRQKGHESSRMVYGFWTTT